MPIDEDDLIRRAHAAYFRAARGGESPAMPSRGGEVVNECGRLYVVLSNSYQTLAVYRVRPSDGVLRRMRRWPEWARWPDRV